MSHITPRLQIFEKLAAIAQAVGQSNRLELLELLAQGRRSVEELASLSEMSFANTSRHLQILRRANLVTTERNGKHIHYSLAGESEVVALIRALGRVGERNVAEVDRVIRDCFHARDQMEALSRAELLGRMADSLVIVLDVRRQDEFERGHLPGARNIPLAELVNRLSELPKDMEIVAYCRGPYCVLSFDAVAVLREKGYRAVRLQDGFPDWKADGLIIETDIRGRNRPEASEAVF